MEYNFTDIEKKWQDRWNTHQLYKVSNDSDKPAFYVLDMFPYPSGAGLHVGHPLGYIASDIYSRFKRLKGFNVLHPMGYDAFGLPAEQYAIEHGIHPAVSTEENIKTFRSQLDKIGLSFDWSRQVKTSDPAYYKWTQWIFLQLFNSWYDRENRRAESINRLVSIFEMEGNRRLLGQRTDTVFTSEDWNSFDESRKREILMQWRLAYCSYGEVNWCEALGTVLANDEVINGFSERGGYPVVKKKLRQWYLRITDYADRLLEGLETVEFSESMKEMQSNWIGKSYGAEMEFKIAGLPRALDEEGHGTGFSSVSTSPPSPLQGRGEEDSEPGYYTNTVDEWKAVSEFAKENRKKSTEAENQLWQELRDRKLDGNKFRRQHPIAGFIPDFVCLEKKIIVEIDGGYHNESEQKNLDVQRSKWLAESAYRIIRFTNEEVINAISEVLSKIKKALSFGEGLGEVSLPGDEAALPNEQSLGEVSSPGDEAGLPIEQSLDETPLRVYTTRPDTIFGVDFMVISPEHELLAKITTADQRKAIDEYLSYVKSRSERERMAEKKVTGCFTGSYAINPFDDRKIPIWVSEYVLAGYGTGAIMAVPCGDERDFRFAKHFGIPITNIIGSHFNGLEANPTKEAILENSGFLNGIPMRDAIVTVIEKIESLGIGKRKVNYKMRDAAFSRQRYWGEPFPIIWKNNIAYALDEKELPLELPAVQNYKPGPDGEGPLANLTDWVDLSQSMGLPKGSTLRETNTMPGYAGSSWYFFRYMDPSNTKEFCSHKASDYWGQVDLYIGGTEHAVGHLLYSRMWTKVLYDLGFVGIDEPYKKLVNQGMIQGVSQLAFRAIGDSNTVEFLNAYGQLSKNPIGDKLFYHYFSAQLDIDSIDAEIIIREHIPIQYVDANRLDLNKFKEDLRYSENSIFYCQDGYFLDGKWYGNDHKPSGPKKFLTVPEVEKMSKSKFNTVNPDDLVGKYGADTFRMYEMFLGPVEQSKPWDTKGIEGVHRFLKKLWRLFFDETKGKIWTEDEPVDAEWKILHKTIRKIEEDTERFSFNTAVSAFMIAVNELHDLKCHRRTILEPLLIILAPYAPHITEELFHLLNGSSVSDQFILNSTYPVFDSKWLIESAKNYPIAINGKTRTELSIGLDASQAQVEELILANDTVKKWLEGKTPKKIIYVKNKMINVVI